MLQVKKALNENRTFTVEYGLAGEEVTGLDTEKGPRGEIWFEGRIQPLPFSIKGKRAVVWTARNITERFGLESQLRRMSETDELTGAYNRRKLLEELEVKFREFRRYGDPTALLMMDVDHFKRVNDKHGHIAGDTVLRSTVQLCMEQLRDVDVFARFGGEEFVVLLPHTELEEAAETAERLRQRVADHYFAHENRRISVTISIGVSVLDRQDQGFESIIKRVDDALYEAKHRGRNCVVVGKRGKPLSDLTTTPAQK
jgi:diguanylate cyclase (GGDEF)-like protein